MLIESGKYNFYEFIGSIEEFPYTAKEEKIDRVKNGFDLLLIGMSKEEVLKNMGEPDSEDFSYKLSNGKKLLYSTWGYYLKRFEKEISTEGYDEAIFLYFKPNNKLYWAKPEGIRGFESKGDKLGFSGIIEP
jgi:hypothetical protein